MVWANKDLRKNTFPVQLLISAVNNVIKLINDIPEKERNNQSNNGLLQFGRRDFSVGIQKETTGNHNKNRNMPGNNGNPKGQN